MEIKETIRLLQSPFTTLEEIPRGRKDGMYFLLDNSSNIEKKKWKEISIWGNSGAWKNVRSPITYFLHTTDRLCTIVKQKKVFCIEKQVNKKIIFVPLEPQPRMNDILEVHRLYQHVASDPDSKQFKRRITCIENVPTAMATVPSNVAFVEYIGTFTTRCRHKNTRKPHKNNFYIRSKDSVI